MKKIILDPEQWLYAMVTIAAVYFILKADSAVDIIIVSLISIVTICFISHGMSRSSDRNIDKN